MNRNQEAVWRKINKSKENGESMDLIVTDMHYPLKQGLEADPEAGFLLPISFSENLPENMKLW